MTEIIKLPSSGSKADQLAHSLVQSGLSFSLYGKQFSFALTPTQLEVERTSEGARWVGTFDLSGTFTGTVAGVLQVDDDGDWAFGFETAFDISGFLNGSIEPIVSDAVWSGLATGLDPLVKLFSNPMIVVAGQSGTLTAPLGGESYFYQPGVNFYSVFDLVELEPFRSLLSTLPPTGPCKTILRVSWLWNGPTFGWIVDGYGPSEQTIIPGMLDWTGLEAYLTGANSDVSLGVVSYFSLNAGNSNLALQGGFEVELGKDAKGILWAALDSAWKNPFGVRGVTITHFGAQLKLPWVSWVTSLAFRGGFTIGGDALDGDFAWMIDESSPENSVISFSSKSGLGFHKLLAATLPPGYLPKQMCEAGLEDVNLYISPKGGWVAGKYYDPGFAIGGTLDLWGWGASVAGRIDYTSGAALQGAIDRIDIRAGEVEVFSLTGADGSGGPTLDFELTAVRQHLRFEGCANLFGGLMKGKIAGEFTPTGFRYRLEKSSSLGMYNNLEVGFDRGTFSYVPRCGFSVAMKLQGISFKVGVTCELETTCSSKRFRQELSFTANLQRPWRIKLGYEVPLPDAAAVEQLFVDKLYAALLAELESQLLGGTKQVFEWVERNVTKSAEQAAKIFEGVGLSEAKIARQLHEVYDLDVDDAVKLVADSSEEAAKIMKNEFDMSAKQVSKALKKTWDLGEKGVKKALKGAGFKTNEIEKALESVWNSIF